MPPRGRACLRAAMGGPYDTGLPAGPAGSPSAVTVLAIDPQFPGTVYAAPLGNGVFRSGPAPPPPTPTTTTTTTTLPSGSTPPTTLPSATFAPGLRCADGC